MPFKLKHGLKGFSVRLKSLIMSAFHQNATFWFLRFILEALGGWAIEDPHTGSHLNFSLLSLSL